MTTSPIDSPASAPKITLENVIYAGFWVRFVASMVDSLLVALLTAPLLTLIYGEMYWNPETVMLHSNDWLISWLLPAIAIIVFWHYKQATPGKMMFSARIVDAKTGAAPSTAQNVGRYLAYFISTIPLCLGFFWIAFDERKQGWHDKLAGTVVIRPANRSPAAVEFTAPPS